MIVFVDLDDTFVKGVNNTWDFIYHFLKERRTIAEYMWRKLLARLVDMFPVSYAKKRVLKILILFGLLKYKVLEKYARTIWIKRLKNNINTEILRNFHGISLILLTACTEIPAKVISQEFGFSDCICTEFKVTRSGRIVGIKRDAFRRRKILLLKEKFSSDVIRKSIYLTDDQEKGLFESIFKKVEYLED